jgi:hypothetical protein
LLWQRMIYFGVSRMNKKTLKQAGYILGILAFISLLFFSLKAESSPYIEINRSVINSETTIGGFGYRINNRWDISMHLIGQGWTKKGEQEVTEMYSLTRVINPTWSVLGGAFYQRVGIAYSPNQQLIGSSNFRLGMGLRWDFVEVEWQHVSSADIHERNTGLDFIALRFLLD